MQVEKLKSSFPRLRQNEPLKNHCTFRVGGPADFFYELINIEELPALIQKADALGIKWKVIGRGSNILFTDKGFRGLIIKNISSHFTFQDSEVIADSGVLLSQIVRASVDRHLTGIEALFGLPGTIGGAIWGNAGVPKVEISDFLSSITTFDPTEGIKELRKEQCVFSYRSSSFQKMRDVILTVTLHLSPGERVVSKELMKKIDEIRRGKQPIGYSAGSFFKNPSAQTPVGLLIEKAGLKGTRSGDAQISEKHGNFFMNIGHAKASDLLKLGELAKKKVKEIFDIDLEMEVKIIGDL